MIKWNQLLLFTTVVRLSLSAVHCARRRVLICRSESSQIDTSADIFGLIDLAK